MQILFADETDKQESAEKHAFFCIASLAVDERFIVHTNQALQSIALEYDLKNLKESRKAGLNENSRLDITKKIVGTLDQNKVKARAIIIGDFTLSRPINREDLYMGALDFLLERWFFTLKKNHEVGVTIFDTVDKKLESKLSKTYNEHVSRAECKYITKSYGFYKEHILPYLLFSDDNYNPLIQAADLIGTSLNSAVVNSLRDLSHINVAGLSKKNKFLDLYWPIFMRSPSGKISGYGIKVWN